MHRRMDLIARRDCVVPALNDAASDWLNVTGPASNSMPRCSCSNSHGEFPLGQAGTARRMQRPEEKGSVVLLGSTRRR